MTNTKVFAIIVLYNPQMPVLQRLLESMINQVHHMVLVDNSTQIPIKAQTQQLLAQYQSSSYLDLEDNLGIATAQNRGIKVAKNLHADFVLLLDQDSALPKTMVKDLMKAYMTLQNQAKKVATVGPIFLDEKTGEVAKLIRHKGLRVNKLSPNLDLEFEHADYVISSGSLINLKTLDKIGLLREDLFIDWVDIEWGLRAKKLGYISYAIPKVVMKHSIGDEFVDFGEKKINLHSDFRNYFIVRNSVYLALHSNLPKNFRITQLAKTPLYIIFYSYHSKRKIYSLGLLTQGIYDGITKNMGKGYFYNTGL